MDRDKIREIIFEHENKVIEACRKKLTGIDFDYDILAEARRETLHKLEQEESDE